MNFKNHYYKIAVDGPAGSGKSTIAKLIAKQLGYLYIDSGAMYRCIALYILNKKLIGIKARRLKTLLQKIKIKFVKQANNKQYIFLNGKDVTRQIRSSSVNNIVSYVSAIGVVRYEMVRRQRDFAKYNSVVMDGRDIGTVVFQNANLKIYLTASVEERAKRRRKDLLELKERISMNALVRQIQDRDNYDSTRKISPLSKANNAIVIDTTSLDISDVLNRVNIFLPYN